MKTIKIFLSAAMILMVSFAASAQTEGTLRSLVSTTNGTALDTVNNTNSRSQLLRVPGSYSAVTVLTTVTEISGTTAGSVKLWGSLDGTNYALVDTASFSPVDQAAAQSHAWQVKPSTFTYYKVTYTGAGTMSAKLATKILRRP